MKMTRNAIIFTAINSVTTLGFLLILSSLVGNQQVDTIGPWALAYGLVWAVSGAALGSTDKARNYRGSIDLQYSLISLTIALFTLWLSKIFLPTIMPVSHALLLLISLGIIGAGSLLYYFGSKNLKGISKEEAFK